MDASSKFKDSLPTAPEAVMDRLSHLGIHYNAYHHPPLRTVEDSKAYRGDMPGLHIKNLYLRDRKKRNFLLVAQEDQSVDLRAVQAMIGCDRLSFGSAERLMEILGVRPGAVSPFSLINDPNHKVQLILDADLADQACVFAHPLVNDMTLGICGSDLIRFFSYTGHDPQILVF